MNVLFCQRVQSWLLETGEDVTAPPPDLCEHVGGCANCLTALAALATTVWHVPIPQAASMCSDCQRNLAAYIDLEREDPGTAVRTYPEVWWHLWTCVDCSEEYDLTCALLKAEAAGDLAPLPKPAVTIPAAPSPNLIDRIRLSRAWVHQVLRPNPTWGVSWGNDDNQISLADQEQAGFRVSISAEKQSDATWSIIVEIDPAVAGQAQVTIGSTVFAAQFRDSGQALIENISELQLVALDGPDIVVNILGV